MRELTRNERLILDHPEGRVPAEKSLDTSEKIAAYVARMRPLNEARVKADRAAEAASWLHARGLWIG
jgi:hypothetical protein